MELNLFARFINSGIIKQFPRMRYEPKAANIICIIQYCIHPV